MTVNMQNLQRRRISTGSNPKYKVDRDLRYIIIDMSHVKLYNDYIEICGTKLWRCYYGKTRLYVNLC